ncbi:hypothetical protein H6P81_018945 [Aristolochia fimbriata]|uniref:Uncharacterized protein n=1 Tax=Aristolochia fimbriata TaxID=158543 RepID=A0AAV7E3Y6_ARIFI|nr:hypothetical protein H6P81_018945 [Aristolochia fimbriata]
MGEERRAAREDRPPAGKPRQPWEKGKGYIPSGLEFSSSAICGEGRLYLDAVTLGGEITLKTAVKSANGRSYVIIPLSALPETLVAVESLTKGGAHGKFRIVMAARTRIGIYDENGVRSCNISELRRSTIGGSVDIPQNMNSGNGWVSLLQTM